LRIVFWLLFALLVLAAALRPTGTDG